MSYQHFAADRDLRGRPAEYLLAAYFQARGIPAEVNKAPEEDYEGRASHDIVVAGEPWDVKTDWIAATSKRIFVERASLEHTGSVRFAYVIPTPYGFDVRIFDVNQLFLDDKRTLQNYLLSLEGKRVELTVEKIRHKRSNQQNKWYWGCILQLISEHTGEEPENLHEALKAHFAPKKVVGNIVVPSSSRYLDTIEFGEYCEKVRRWAAEELSIDIPDPGDVRI